MTWNVRGQKGDRGRGRHRAKDAAGRCGQQDPVPHVRPQDDHLAGRHGPDRPEERRSWRTRPPNTGLSLFLLHCPGVAIAAIWDLAGAVNAPNPDPLEMWSSKSHVDPTKWVVAFTGPRAEGPRRRFRRRFALRPPG
jgi:hypothetical protein